MNGPVNVVKQIQHTSEDKQVHKSEELNRGGRERERGREGGREGGREVF